MVKIDTVWDHTVAFTRDHLSGVLPYALAGLAVPNTILSLLTPLWATTAPGGRLGLFVATMALVLVMLWASLAITIRAIDPLDRGATAALALRRLGPSVGVYLLLALVFGLLIIPVSILSVFAGLDPAAMQAGASMPKPSGASGSLLLYLLLLLVVTLVLVARMMPLTAVIAAERRGVRAISRTWRLTRGMTWKLIAVTLLYYIVSGVAGLAARTVFGTIFSLFGSSEGAVTVPGVLTAFVAAVVSAGFTTLAAVFAAKLYVALADTPAIDPDRPTLAKPL